jgi:hypothetical protein
MARTDYSAADFDAIAELGAAKSRMLVAMAKAVEAEREVMAARAVLADVRKKYPHLFATDGRG